MLKKISIRLLLAILLLGSLGNSKVMKAIEVLEPETTAIEEDTATQEDAVTQEDTGNEKINGRPMIVETYSSADDLQLVVNHLTGEVESAKCLIAAKNCEVKEIFAIKDKSMSTLVLIDNSASIKKEQRAVIQQVIEGIIDTKQATESISIATVGKEIEYLVDYSKDRYEILKAFEKVEYKKQTTHLAAGLAQAIDNLNAIQDDSVKRIIVFSDGYNNNTEGKTRTELLAEMNTTTYPIFTIGCVSEENKGDVNDNLYQFSRATIGESGFSVKKDTSIEEILQYLNSIYSYIGIKVKPDNTLLDGSEKAIELTLNMQGGSNYTIQKDNLRMKMVEQKEVPETAQPKATQVPQEVEVIEEKNFLENIIEQIGMVPFVLIVIVIFVALVALVCFIVLKMKKKNDRMQFDTKLEDLDIIINGGKNVKEETNNNNITRGFIGVGDDIEKTVVLPKANQISPPNNNEDLDSTVILSSNMQNKECWNVQLKDIKNNRIFAKQLTSEIMIGRVENPNYAQMVVLDYDNSVSKVHCRIFLEKGEFYLEDLQSVNHTFLNGNIIKNVEKISSEDVIGIGNVKMKVFFEQYQ